MSELKLGRPRIEIRPIGSYYEVDAQGYLLPNASLDKIGARWVTLLEEVVNVYRSICGDNLHSVYLRGSVAVGADTDISDFDSWAFLKEHTKYSGFEEAELELLQKYPFCREIEFSPRPLDPVYQARTLLMSVCLWGNDVSSLAPRLMPGISVADNASVIEHRLGRWTDRLLPELPNEELTSNIEWLCKFLLRVGSELAMISSGRFTRDLYLCAKEIAEQYPEFADISWQILDLALNPAGDTEEIKSMLEPFVGFCFYEADRLGVTKPIGLN